MTSKSKKVFFLTNPEKNETLRRIAETLDVSIGEVINDALDRYIDVCEWQVKHIQEGVKAAVEGNFASDEDIDEFLKKYC